MASDIKSVQRSLLPKHTQTVHSRCLLTSPNDYCLQSYLIHVSPASTVYSKCPIKSDVLCRLLTKFSFSESHALRSSASYSLSLGIISQTILFKGLQVARVEHSTVLRRYFCLVVLKPNVERDNDFID